MFRNPVFWFIVILLIIVVFGASKLPDIASNLGKGLKVFKKEMKELQEDTDLSDARTVINDQTSNPPQQQAPSQQAAPNPPQQQAPNQQQAPQQNQPSAQSPQQGGNDTPAS